MKKILRKIKVWRSRNEHKGLLKKLNNGEYFLKYKIPYFCQFASREKVKDFIYPEYSGNHAQDDPRWKEFGARDKEDYAYWAMSSCGAIVLRMVLESIGRKYKNNMEIVSEGLSIGAYDDGSGWIHGGLIKLSSKYGLEGKSRLVGPEQICGEILKNHFVIASVSPQIGERNTPVTKFGHLVLIKGFRWKDNKLEGFYINNPSGREIELQEDAFIPRKRFEEAFTSRVIILKHINEKD